MAPCYWHLEMCVCVVLPGFGRSMVLSWLVRPPEEDSPLDVPSRPKWGSKDSSGWGAAAYLQDIKENECRG